MATSEEVELITLSSDSEDEDPRLCFYSEKFDPLYALTVPDIKIPEPKAKVFDNLDIYKNNIDRKEPREAKKREQVDETLKASQIRRWLPHQSRLIMFLF